MWVHYADPETKARSKLWKRAGSPTPKKFKLSVCWQCYAGCLLGIHVDYYWLI